MPKTTESTTETAATETVEVPAAPPAVEEPLIEVRLLVDYDKHTAGSVAELPESIVKALVENGLADDSKDAIAYAKAI